MVDALVNAQAPTYETVLDLDRKIRQTTLPAVRLYLTPDEDDYTNPGLCMKGYLMSQYRSICMFSLCAIGVPLAQPLLIISYDIYSQVCYHR